MGTGPADKRVVLGDLYALCAEKDIEYDKHCWSVVLSTKPVDKRCTMCTKQNEKNHGSRNKKMHAPLLLSKATRSKYQLDMGAYQKKYPRQPAAPSAPVSSAQL